MKSYPYVRIDGSVGALVGTAAQQATARVFIPATVSSTGNGAVTVALADTHLYHFQATGDITSLTLSAGNLGQRVSLYLKQNASGAAANWPGTLGGCVLPSGLFEKSLGPDATDVFLLEWNDVLNKWVCLFIAVDVS